MTPTWHVGCVISVSALRGDRTGADVVTKTVLVVDDDRETVELLKELLSEEGYEVRLAFDGQMALEAVDRVPTDLVVADIAMPRLDGLELARRLLARHQPMPVVLLSAALDGIDLPNVIFIAKPFDVADVVRAVAATLADPSGARRSRRTPPVAAPPPGDDSVDEPGLVR